MHASKIKVAIFGCAIVFLFPGHVEAAQLFLSPSTGSFATESIFDVSVFLDTEGETINTLDIFIGFPPDKLQIVSPGIGGQSIIGIWTGVPSYDNQKGVIHLRGGMPDGINVNRGLIAKFTFRGRHTGTAAVKFLDNTRVLLHDGKGTDVLNESSNAVYGIVLPPSQGPLVVSETHPVQSFWYPLTTALLRWEEIQGASGYSYILSNRPSDIPDSISEGDDQSVSYTNLSEGTHYFHVRAKREGTWGGVSHFVVNVDTELPAAFPVTVAPSSRTTSKNPIISFQTTDVGSGLDRYEYRLVSLNPSDDSGYSFFVETSGDEVLSLDLGSYDIIARAYDKAGNYRDSVQRIRIVTPFFQFINGDGLRVLGLITISWFWVFVLGILFAVFLWRLGIRVRTWHHGVIERHEIKELPREVREKLHELKKYRQKYGKALLLLLVFSGLFFGNFAFAQQIEISPPFIATVSRNISNEEIFYVGGKTDEADVEVVIYLQNLQTGETRSQAVKSDRKNEWFYRHNTFLSTGNYLLWAQTIRGDELSPPSPQITMTVQSTAIQFGASRFSFEIIYLILVILLSFVVAGLVAYISFHAYHGRKKHSAFMKEVREAEESVRRGFAVLKRDIQEELKLIHKMKNTRTLSEEERKQEDELLKDIAWAEQYIGKEIWDIEKADHYH